MLDKAIFFDRDGCLIVDKDYLSSPQGIEYFSDTISSLRKIQRLGFKIFIVTNQSGIGRGYFSEDEMHAVHRKIIQDFKKENIHLEEIVFCPHAPTDKCECRKPSPKLINELITKYNIDKNNSYMIGDKISDAKCGLNANIKGCLIFNEDINFLSFKNLTDFADYLEKH